MFIAATGFSRKFYVAAIEGNDANDGLTMATPWQTLGKVNTYPIGPSDRDSIFIKGGSNYNGQLFARADWHRFFAYGTGKPVIKSELQPGFVCVDKSNIRVKGIIFQGVGYNVQNRTTHGMFFNISATATKQASTISIADVEVYGYGGAGIYVGSDNVKYGYSYVTITGSLAHDNGMSGIWTTGSWNDTLGLIRKIHTNTKIENVKAYNNHGRIEYKDNWSGSGILVAGTVTALVYNCEAYGNGRFNGCAFAGPVGIWCDDSKGVIIRSCYSHHNKGGAANKDGGGFDIDGGSESCVVENCTSKYNVGAGYAMFQWTTGNPYLYDTIRNNTSHNDGLHGSGYAGLTLWGETPNHKVTNSVVYGNTFTRDTIGQIVTFLNGNMLNIQIYNNSFCATGLATYNGTVPSGVSMFSNTYCGVLGLKTTAPKQVTSITNYVVYPNPVITDLNVNLPNGKYNMELMDMMGRRIFKNDAQIKTSKYSVNVNNMRTGMYSLFVYDGMLTRVLKVVKQ